jgi:capsular polysaccharide transport system permease protein
MSWPVQKTWEMSSLQLALGTLGLTVLVVSCVFILHNCLAKAQNTSGRAWIQKKYAHMPSDLSNNLSAGLPQNKGRAMRKRVPRAVASVRTVAALMLREMATTYGRSPGGYLWAVLEPVAGIALLSVLFSFALVHPALGTNFQLFYATGLVPLTMFVSISGRVGHALNFSRPLMAYPSVTFMDAILARFILNTLTQVMVAYIIFAGIFLIFDTKVIIKLPYIAAAFGLTAILALGIGTLNCFLFTRFPIWQQAWSILTRPLFIVSCVFLIYDGMPRLAQEWLWYNPIVHIVGMMRHGFYSTYHATYVSVGYVVVVSGICMVFGLLLLRRHQYTLLQR